MSCDLARGRTEISSSDTKGEGGEIRESISGMKKGAVKGRVIERGLITGMSHDPHMLHPMNEKSADWMEGHSKRLLLSSWGGEGREKELTLEGNRCNRIVVSNTDQ